MRGRISRRQSLMLSWGTAGLLVVVSISALVVLVRAYDRRATAGEEVAGLTSVLSREVDAEMVRFTFAEVAETAGLHFAHFPLQRTSQLPEDTGSGLAWGDYDGDGDPDLYLVNIAATLGAEIPDGPEAARSALYQNDGDGTFSDVSAAAGVDAATIGMGAAWGDYDNDGDQDLYVTNYGPNILYRNDGDGTFSDVTQASGTGGDSFSAGCSWADYDRDGDLDLYVCCYVRFEHTVEAGPHSRQYGAEIPYTINPSVYPPVANRLYRNNGDGSFSDVAQAAGVANESGRSLGAAWFDFDNDGLTDLYVANDVSANGVFHNQGDGTFADIGASSLAADYRGAMGLAVGDFEHDGDLDLLVTHWLAQENAFYQNMVSDAWTDENGQLRLFFMDAAETLGLGQISLPMVGWSTAGSDLDNDGYLDLWVVNGNTLEAEDDPSRLKPQPMFLFWHQPGQGFFEIGQASCNALGEPIVGRGGACADFDGDGRLDIAVGVHGGQPLLLRNTTEGSNHWLSLRLRQTGGNTHALGARVTLRAGGLVHTAQVAAGGPYLSQDDNDLHFGLGSAEVVDDLCIDWPDGGKEQFSGLAVDRKMTITHAANYP